MPALLTPKAKQGDDVNSGVTMHWLTCPSVSRIIQRARVM